jgi:hypothetical protein
MIAVKAFLESVEGACPDVAKNYTQGADNQYKGCILVGMVIGFRVGGGEIEVIEKPCIQSQHDKRFRKPKSTKGSLSATADFLIPVYYKNCDARSTKMVLSKRRCPLKLVFALRGPANWRNNITPPEGCQGLKGLSPYDFLRREVWIDRN